MMAALIIAAGKTDRKNKFSPEKQFGRITAIERMALTFKIAGVQRIVVVGDENEVPKKLVPSMNLIFLTASAEGEMLDSIKTGLTYLQDKCTEVLIATVDVPMFSIQTVQSLLKAKGAIRIPAYRGRCGHPVLISFQCFEKIIDYSDGNGLKGAIESAILNRKIVEVDDAGILSDRRDGIDYENLVPQHDMMKMRASYQIRMSKEQVFYGPGTHQLLQLIEEVDSLSTACQYMGISYTKGRKMIRRMEQELGMPVLETRQGGKEGGYSRLTPEAKRMVQSYNAFQAEAEAELEKLFQKHFAFYL